ncbi:MAG: metallophosphoesterase family protein [Bryobacteraceae bacterium]|nr:metallophosphoesterase family protein [Bryobacteraceae bacterium]
MRAAVVSDIHGNLTAFEAVLADVRAQAPDLVLHGGDLAESGSSPAEIVDEVRALGWAGALGNTDEMQTRPESLDQFVATSKAPPVVWAAVREMAAATRARLGDERIRWLAGLPDRLVFDEFTLLHASPGDPWRAPGPAASDEELKNAFQSLGATTVVYGHTHHAVVHRLAGWTVANSGSAGMPYDGDPRAAYLLIDQGQPRIRRVPYNVEREVQRLRESSLPQWQWMARMLRTVAPSLPEPA